VVPNALVPFSNVAAVDVAAVLGGAVIVEQVFGWQGMGQMLLDGVSASDTNVVLAWLVVAAALVLAMNLLADIVAARIDPRVRLE
jgi:peptide/nickel transport system permease protein